MRATMAIVLVSAVVLPARTASGDVAPAPSRTPFTSTRPGEVVVPVTIGGHGPFRFLLDTGSTHSAVTARVAVVVGAAPVARTVMRATAGPVTCLVVALPPLSVGAAAAAGITATVLPAGAEGVLGTVLDGVLGQDFLARFDFTIDYRRSRIDWHESGYAAPGIRLTLVHAHDRWLVELPQPAGSEPSSDPGSEPCSELSSELSSEPSSERRADSAHGVEEVHRFVPDSGADTLVLFEEARTRCLVAEWHAGTADLGSLTGTRAVRTATVVGLRVGDTTLERQTAAIVPAPAADGADGLLPLHLFARVFFSARSRALVVQPR
ncbi:MAG: aspartyl protease family protein [Vicinamibacteraceae bacterium]